MSKARQDIDRQAAWQAAMYRDMNEHMPDGVGSDVEWLQPVVDEVQGQASPGIPWIRMNAEEIEGLLRKEWDYPADGTPEAQDKAARTCTWLRILREEVAEAFGAEDEQALRAELVQIAAVARNWIETIDRRKS